MKIKPIQFIYGPVPSWRLGRSLGIDPLSQPVKPCNFNCVYCQIGRTPPRQYRRAVFVPTAAIIAELKALPPCVFDVITLSGSGEPTLARNLGAIIRGIKKVRTEPVAVITNSTLLGSAQVRKELCAADIVMAKLDAVSAAGLAAVNAPAKGITSRRIIAGLKAFRGIYRGRFALQIMFVGPNAAEAPRLADIAQTLAPDIVYLNTPLRDSAVKPLSRTAFRKVHKVFLNRGLTVAGVYDTVRSAAKPLCADATHKRRGKE